MTNRFYMRNRRKNIIEKGNCEDKHVFDKRDIMKASLSFNMDYQLKCLRCGKIKKLGEIIAEVAEKENIDLTGKNLFNKYKDMSKE